MSRIMRVSVCTTLYNEKGNVRQFLDSLLTQTLTPDEIVIVDGGSTDGTTGILQEVAGSTPVIRLIVDPACNIKHLPSPVARGRNIAIQEAHGEIIAVTDAGCKVDPRWLEEIVRPLLHDDSIDVVGGWYEPWVETPFERCAATVSFTTTKTQIARGQFPSSRSIAFRKNLWERVGGYPEVVLTAEDSLFNAKWKESGAGFAFAERAIVYWKPRGSFRPLCRQFYRYSVGDALSGIHGALHARWAAKFLFLLVLLVLGVVGSPLFLVLAAIMVIGYGSFLWARRTDRGLFFCPVVLKIVIDAIRVAGYLKGLFKRRFRRAHSFSL
jgi:glycosyltransferase involved in cell wall biosynthesis